MANLTKLGKQVIGTTGTIIQRKGYVCHIDEALGKLWVRMETGEIMTDVPIGAVRAARGRPATVHSIIASKREKWYGSFHEKREAALVEAERGCKAPLASPWAEIFGSHAEMKTGVMTEKETTSVPFEVLPRLSDIEVAPKARPYLPLVGMDGNAFFLIGSALGAAKKAGWTSAQCEAWRVEAMSGDYGNVLQCITRDFTTNMDDEEGEDEESGEESDLIADVSDVEPEYEEPEYGEEDEG